MPRTNSKKKKEKKKKSEAFERQNIAILVILIIFFILTISLYFIFNISLLDYSKSENNSNSDNNPSQIIVSRVIDGDTFELSSGEIIRLICIDSPEKTQKGYEEANQFLSDLILNKEPRLEKDVSDKDEYGRLLRYVYVNDSNKEVFVNKELVKQGYATVFPYGNDTKRCNEIAS